MAIAHGSLDAAIDESAHLLSDLLGSLFDVRTALPEGSYLEICDLAKRAHDQLRLAQQLTPARNERDPFAAWDGRELPPLPTVPTIVLAGRGPVPFASLAR